MRRTLPLALAALLFAISRPAPLAAWGFNGHRFITDRAIDLLPPELRPFFQANRVAVVEHSIDPDTYRTMGFTEEDPRHFLDMDAYGAFPFKNLPHDMKEAIAVRGQDFVTKNGTLPWRTEEVYGLLRTAFKDLGTVPYARDNVKLFSSVIAHYVGDAHQPFHAAVNYNGQLTNQHGIHARFETEMFDRYRDRLKIAPAPANQIPNVREFMFETLTESFSNVDAILAADRDAVQGRTLYDDGYFGIMFGRTGPIMEKRLSAAVSGVASLIMSAWIEAGRPALPVTAPPSPPRPIRR
jgi:hypothetical protein